MQTRKQFLKNTVSIASGATLFGFKGIADSVIQNPMASYITFDLHGHPGRLFEKGSSGFGEIVQPGKTLGEMNSAHLTGAFFGLVADAKILKLGDKGVSITGKYSPGEAWEEYKRQLKDMKDFF